MVLLREFTGDDTCEIVKLYSHYLSSIILIGDKTAQNELYGTKFLL